MKTFIITTILAVATMFTTATAEVKEKTIEIKNFEEIALYGSPKVIYAQGPKCSVRIKADETIIDLAEAYSDGKTLSLSRKGNNIQTNIGLFDFLRGIKKGSFEKGEVIFYVTSPDLTAVTLSGSGDFVSNKKVDTDKLSLCLRGSGDIHFTDIICDQFESNLMGSGDIDIDCLETLTSNLQLRGSGDIEVSQQKVRQTELNVIGSGDIKVNCIDCDIINASVTGSGDITISGDVKKVNKSIRGSGDIHRMNEKK